MVGSFIAIFVMAMLYEGLKVFREVLQQKRGKICSKQIENSIHYERLSSSIDEVPTIQYGAAVRKPKYVCIYI